MASSMSYEFIVELPYGLDKCSHDHALCSHAYGIMLTADILRWDGQDK